MALWARRFVQEDAGGNMMRDFVPTFFFVVWHQSFKDLQFDTISYPQCHEKITFHDTVGDVHRRWRRQRQRKRG